MSHRTRGYFIIKERPVPFSFGNFKLKFTIDKTPIFLENLVLGSIQEANNVLKRRAWMAASLFSFRKPLDAADTGFQTIYHIALCQSEPIDQYFFIAQISGPFLDHVGSLYKFILLMY